MITRFIEGKIIKLLNYYPVIGIIGPRQVGKTSISKQLIPKISKPSIYLDLENPRDITKLKDPVLFFEDNIDKCIILDEIQNMPELFPILRSMTDLKREPARYMILGSASPDTLTNSSESLAGRIAYVELSPFNITEIKSYDNYYERLWLQGGFPDAYLMPDADMAANWHLNYIRTYIERDLPMLGLKVDRNTLNKLFQMLSHIHGNIINYNNISGSLGIDSKTVKRYISFLERAFIIRQLMPFHTNIKKRLIKSPKLFFRDSGVLHYLQNISSKEDLYGHPILGNSWEGFVIEQIIQLISDKYQYYFYRTHDGAECDLVIVKSQIPVMSIEIKYTSTPKLTRGTTIAFDDLKTENNFIITPNGDDYLLRKDVRTCNLYDFLQKYLINLS